MAFTPGVTLTLHVNSFDFATPPIDPLMYALPVALAVRLMVTSPQYVNDFWTEKLFSQLSLLVSNEAFFDHTLSPSTYKAADAETLVPEDEPLPSRRTTSFLVPKRYTPAYAAPPQPADFEPPEFPKSAPTYTAAVECEPHSLSHEKPSGAFAFTSAVVVAVVPRLGVTVNACAATCSAWFSWAVVNLASARRKLHVLPLPRLHPPFWATASSLFARSMY